MNPRVSPTTKNASQLSGKKKLSRDTNGDATSLIKDGERTVKVNYDLSVLDVVPLAVKTVSPKRKHVHFLPDTTSLCQNKAKSDDENFRKNIDFINSSIASKVHCSRQGSDEIATGHKDSSYSSVRNDNQSLTDKATTAVAATSENKTSTRRSYSLKVPDNQAGLTRQRNHVLSIEETRLRQNVNSSSQVNQYKNKEISQSVKIKVNRSLPTTPSKSTLPPASSAPANTPVTIKLPSATSTPAHTPVTINHKPPTGSRKDIAAGLSVHFADSVTSSPKHKNKLCSKNVFNNSPTPSKKSLQTSSLCSDTDQKFSVQKEFSKIETGSRSVDNVASNLKKSKPSQYKQCNSEDNSAPIRSKDTAVSIQESQFIGCPQAKYTISSTTNATGAPSSTHAIGRSKKSNESQRDDNFPNQSFTNLDSNMNLSSTSLLLQDQMKNDSHLEAANDISRLASTPSVSSKSLNKDITNSINYDLLSKTSAKLPELSHHRTLSDGFKQTSRSPITSISSTPEKSSKLRPRRSPSCLDKDYVVGNCLSYIASKDLAEIDNTSVSHASRSKLPLATLSNLGPNSTTNNKTSEIDLLPFGNTKYVNLAAVVRKEAIAASYQLEYCWFCGRLMPTWGTSVSDGKEHVRILGELERLLAQAQSEKAKLVEEQVRLRESEMMTLQKNEALEKELEEIKCRERQAQMDDTSEEFDLRAYIESLGHQLEICPHVLITTDSCRGFLHMKGGRFKTWKMRWFVFDRTRKMVFYYKDKTEASLKGSVCFQTIQDVYVDHLRTIKSLNPKLTFCLKMYQRTHYLVAPSSETMTIWIDVLLSGVEGYEICHS